MIRYEKDTNNIVTLTLDMSGGTQNVLSQDIAQTFVPLLQHLQKERDKGELRGVIITSAKQEFLVGGGVEFFYNSNDAVALHESSQALTHFFRDLESPGVTVVAALNGSALGSGFGFSLACHHRIAIDKSHIQLGLPETSLGIIPRGGEIVRLLWLLNIEKAYHVLCDGLNYTPKEALSVGIIDDLATDERDLMAKAKLFLMENRQGCRPWDEKPNQTYAESTSENVNEAIRKLIGEQFKRHRNLYPAYEAVLDVLSQASTVDFDTACKIQSRYFAQVCLTKEAKNMMRAFWYDTQAVRNGQNRPKGFGKFRPKKVGVIGAGLMGSGIAYACAQAGLNVVIKDISRSVAEKGKNYAEKKLDGLVKLNQLGSVEAKEMLTRITATERATEFTNCDIVIEAVFENQALKSKVIKEIEPFIDEYCLVASNTNSIPINKLAKTSAHSEQFCGLRFFRPVDEEPLVEIVRGENTSSETIARAIDFVKLIKKIPIVVKDSWGFFAGRVRNTYILEGIAMLDEGYPAALIENLGIQSGMLQSPLCWADDLSLDLISEFEKQAAELYGPKYIRHPAANLLEYLMNIGRNGAYVRAGFYDYSTDAQTRTLWRGLSENKTMQTTFDAEHLIERLLFVQSLEALWCLQEGVIQSVAEANVGSIFGWRFPAIKGGVIQYINHYGIEAFIARCAEYEKLYGPRFRVPKILKQKAVDKTIF